MANTPQTKDSYAVLENEQQIAENQAPATVEKAPAPQAAKKNEQDQNIPVQNTAASVPDNTNWIDVIIKVIIDVIARLTWQKSPTGNKLPTAMIPQEKAQQVSKSLLGSVTGWLHKIWDSMEKMADTAVNSAWSVVQKAKDQAQSTVNQAVDAAKNQAQGAVDAAKVVGQSAVNVAKDSVSDVVDTAKEAAHDAKEVANTAVDSAKNVAQETTSAATAAVDTAKKTVSQKDPLL